MALPNGGTKVSHGRKIAVIGLGYVGLPVAVAFGRAGAHVIGFDIDPERVRELHAGRDRTREVAPADLRHPSVTFTADPGELKRADFFIVTVPTPIDDARRPDLAALRQASQTVGKAMRKGAIVVYESTVYPGATEEDCVPVLEEASGLKAGRGFTVGYSPERINPGDAEHRFETIKKVVAGQDAETLDVIAAVYGSVVKAGIHRAPSIKVAEAAKVIENTQRDLNIALMNELAIIFDRLGINTMEVLRAAGTKWNFLPFRPGLVGGHCIGVDPYYLTHKAEMVGYHPEVILAGRRINDGMGKFVAEQTIKHLVRNGWQVKDAPVVVLGLTFKEDCADLRNSRVIDVIRELQSYGAEVVVHDPVAVPPEALHEYGVELVPWGRLPKAAAIVAAVAHRAFKARPAADYLERLLPNAVIADVKSQFNVADFSGNGVTVWRL
jgi:UDP-N-acetyl-D-glucosamine/UDP-N-acetyl-D-galactosamine dehydrogenase